MIDIQPNNYVSCTAQKDNVIYLGGYFTAMGQYSRSRVASFNLTIGSITDFNPSFDSSVLTICVGSTKIAFGGLFSSVSYKGVTINNCGGLVFYNIAEDKFEIITRTNLGASSIYKIVYHSSTGAFYICGTFLFDCTDNFGNARTYMTAAFGVTESNLGILDLGYRYISGTNRSTLCQTCLIVGDILYLGVNAQAGSYNSYNIANINAIAGYDWAPVYPAAPESMAYVAGNIWTHAQGGGAYRTRSDATTYTIGTFGVFDPATAAPQAPSTGNYLRESTFNYMGGRNVRHMWEDSNYIYLLGAFWGIGLSGYDQYNVLGGITRISKTTYLPACDKHDLRKYDMITYMSNTFPYINAGNGFSYFEHSGDVYVFGLISTVDGSIRSNAYAPYIINSDFSKKQQAACLFV